MREAPDDCRLVINNRMAYCGRCGGFHPFVTLRQFVTLHCAPLLVANFDPFAQGLDDDHPFAIPQVGTEGVVVAQGSAVSYWARVVKAPLPLTPLPNASPGRAG